LVALKILSRNLGVAPIKKNKVQGAMAFSKSEDGKKITVLSGKGYCALGVSTKM
jgi:hypothetical protein